MWLVLSVFVPGRVSTNRLLIIDIVIVNVEFERIWEINQYQRVT